MLANRDPNPHLYPSLPYYANALAALLFNALPALWSGTAPIFLEPISITMGATFAPDPDAVALYRGVSILVGTISVLLMYAIGKRTCGVSAGLVAALLASVSPSLVAHSRYVTPDGYVILFELLAMLASCAIVGTGKRACYVAAGIAVGAAAASKYNGALVCIFPIVAHVLRRGWAPRATGPLWIAAVASVLAFLIFNPYILLDAGSVLGVIYQFRTYSSPHQGMEGNVLLFYLQQLWLTTGLASVLALAQAVLGLRRKSAPTILLVSFAAVYFLFISSFTIRNERTLLPMVPCVLLLAAIFVADLASAKSALRSASPMLRRTALVALGIALLYAPSLRTIKQAVALTTIDSRTTAREWINSNLPEHSLVAVESYAPFVSPARFRVTQSERAIDRPPAWYVRNGVDYVVLSQGMFGRYFDDPKHYAADALRYVELVKSMALVKRFTDGGYEVSVYQTRREPATESAAPAASSPSE